MVFIRLNIDALKKRAPIRAEFDDSGELTGVLGNQADTRDARTQAEAKADCAGELRRSTEKDTGAPQEFGGPKGLEPTRYGDWEKAGRCFDF